MDKNFPCKCGHALKDHDKKNNTMGCWICSIEGNWWECENGFILDKLKYLEQQYERTKL